MSISGDKKIIVKAVKEYGKVFIYPVCDTAKLFLQLTKNKSTLTHHEIKIIKSLGYSVEVEQERITL